VVSAHVAAPAERVRALYEDAAAWAVLFPATIRGARVVRREGAETVVEVDHVEGKVVNVLRDVSSTRVDLEEWKRRYDARFANTFLPEPGGSRYTLAAEVRLKGAWRLLAPFVAPLVRARLRWYVVEPLRRAAEGGT
jgi:hypothetical protein